MNDRMHSFNVFNLITLSDLFERTPPASNQRPFKSSIIHNVCLILKSRSCVIYQFVCL